MRRGCGFLRAPVRLAVLLSAVLLAATVPAPAWAEPGGSGAAVQQIFAQCPSGHLSSDYSVAQLQEALSVMPAAVSQYTSCPDVVQTALIHTRRHEGTGAGSAAGGPFLPVPVIGALALLLATGAGLGVMALRRR